MQVRPYPPDAPDPPPEGSSDTPKKRSSGMPYREFTPEQRQRKRDWTRAWMQQRHARGVCIQCGEPMREGDERWKCTMCQMVAEHSRSSKKRRS